MNRSTTKERIICTRNDLRRFFYLGSAHIAYTFTRGDEGVVGGEGWVVVGGVCEWVVGRGGKGWVVRGWWGGVGRVVGGEGVGCVPTNSPVESV